MKHGVFMFPTHDAIDPGSLARMAEEYGFESLFFPEHSHIPASRLTPFPLGGELPGYYARTFDLFVALTAAALATSRLLIGSGICLLAQRDTIHCAKEAASVDHLSGGRVLFGVGAGWNEEEAASHGIDPKRRFAIMREKLEAVRAIWTQDEASYHGEHVDIEAIWCWPKPLQQPHPPVLLGGNGPTVTDRVLAYADEWMPNPEEHLPERIAEFRSRTRELGREVPVSVYGAPTDRREIARHAEAGASRYVHHLPPVGRDEVERRMEAIVAEVDGLGA
jgi:probable F420-dependent oxidoreductase